MAAVITVAAEAEVGAMSVAVEVATPAVVEATEVVAVTTNRFDPPKARSENSEWAFLFVLLSLSCRGASVLATQPVALC